MEVGHYVQTHLLTTRARILGFQTNRKKIKNPCREFRMSVTYEYSSGSPTAQDSTSASHVTPITMKRRRYKLNLTNGYLLEDATE